ncbi:hypothetical protein [Kineococcus sp. SYSU DK005]|uniref:hypothetical protein n=1 Tax=Kineococcus sp. SYSU DK005 TaxID=3383126 RepID=UPI003D7EB15A
MLSTRTRRGAGQRPGSAPASISGEVGSGLKARTRRGPTSARVQREAAPVPVPQAMGWTPGAAHGASAVRIALVLALVCGPAALVLQQLDSSPAAPRAVVASARQDAGEVAAVGNFAAEFVTAWLTTPAGGEQALGFYLQSTAGLRLPGSVPRVQNVAVADVERVADYGAHRGSSTASSSSTATTAITSDAASPRSLTSQAARAPEASTAASTWQVSVAADVEEPGADGERVMVRRYFAVPVLQRGGTGAAVAREGAPQRERQVVRALRALMLPQPLAGPASGEGAELDYDQQVNPAGSLATSVRQFLAAYAAGAGDVTRYVTPGAPISAITPAAYADVQVQSVLAREGDPSSDEPADGQRAQVLVTATLITFERQQSTAQYALALTARGGRWEISALEPVPALVPPTGATASPASSPASSTPSTGTAGRQ